MATPISYNDFVTAVQNAYSGGSSLTWSEVSASLARGGCTTDNYLQYLESFPNAVDVVKNADGTIRAARINPYASIYNTSSWEAASAAGSYNSNLVPATAGSGSTALVTVPGNAVTQTGSTSLTFTQGLNQAGNFVLKEVAPAVMAAGLGIKLGRAIDGAIYNIGTAMGLDPPWSLNPETWDSITSGSSDPASRLFNTVFGIDGNGKAQMYADEDTIALLSYWMMQQGLLAQGSQSMTPIDLGLNVQVNADSLWYMTAQEFMTRFMIPTARSDYSGQDTITNFYDTNRVGGTFGPGTIGIVAPEGNGSYYWRGNPVIVNQTATIQSSSGNDRYTLNKVLVRTTGYIFTYNLTQYPRGLFSYGASGGDISSITSISQYPANGRGGAYVGDFQTVPPVPGVTSQTGATQPDTSSWTSPEAAIQSLRQQYPDWFANPVSNDVVQPDGTVTTYYYYPIGFPEPDGSTGTQTQQDTQVDPDDSTQTLVDYLIQILTQLNPETDPQTQTQPQTDSPTVPPNPTDTGDGDTPIVPPITGSASSLWKIYNPSQGQIDAFGAWLWSSDFIDQLKKLFNDPMQAIIGVHKVFCTPSVGGSTTIKCGYLDSEVPSNWVSNQYTHIDCGTVNLPEYFGNVFDYDPFTRVSLFIPCVGIVPLDVAEVMRSSINVKLHCDVLTGALLAEVYVYRDGAGGNLYTYSGSCIVTYPVSSGTYVGAVANVVSVAASVAAGIMGTVASGGALAPAAVGAAGAAVSGLAHTRTNVQHSGSFSGAAGVMGGKIPYLIITRPQTRMADQYPAYDGVPANFTSRLGACTGYVKVKEVHLKVPNAYESEIAEIEQLLHQGVLI